MPIKNSTNTTTIYLNENQRIDQLSGYMFPPNSIIEKRYTGIGATQSEIKAARNSIIVFPSRSIAYNKSLSNRGTFYVGSLPDKKKIRNEDIREYYNNTRIKHKKYLVVANSLPRLFEVLGETSVYTDFFLMFDEIDKFQGESTFRVELENCLDYFKPAERNGCLVSATVGSFSNLILNSLVRIHVEVANPRKHPVTLYRIDQPENVIKFLYFRIQQEPKGKFLIAQKSIKTILRIIRGLDLMTRNDVKILCGDGSSEEVENYYGTLVNDRLPGRINFMTAAYFSGVDILEDFHLIILSDTTTSFTLLTISEMRQIVGRGRKKLLSIDLLIPKKQEVIKLLKRTELMASAKRALSIAIPFQKYLHELQLDEGTVRKNSRAHALLTFNNVLLLREDRYQKLKISTFTIDQYWNSHKELRLLYSLGGSPMKSLSEYFTITVGIEKSSGLDFTDETRRSFLHVLCTENTLTEAHAVNSDEKRIYARFKLSQLLMDHTDINWIIDGKYWSRISFKKEYITRYMGKFPRMHELWKFMERTFEIGKFYTDAAIKNAVSAGIVHYTDGIISISSSDHIPVLQGFFDITKTSTKKINGYKINAMKNAHSRFPAVKYAVDEVNKLRRFWEMC